LSGIPIGIKCDDKGHVYAGCSDGIEIWNTGGMLQAVVEIPGECGIIHVRHRFVLLPSANDWIGGVTNFCFGRCSDNKKEIFVCAEQRLWHLQFGDEEEAQFQTDRTGWMEW
jgi:gluconolactonase